MSCCQITDQENVVMELKYCERCGGLWLRACGDEATYCGRCQTVIATWLQIRTKTARTKIAGARGQGGMRDHAPRLALPRQFVIRSLRGVAEQPLGGALYGCSSGVPEVRL